MDVTFQKNKTSYQHKLIYKLFRALKFPITKNFSLVFQLRRYFKSHVREWKNKKGLIHFLLLDIKWERKQKDVKNNLRHFYQPKISQIVVQKCIFLGHLLNYFVLQKVWATHYLMKEFVSSYVQYVQVSHGVI